MLLRAALGLLPPGARWQGEVYWDGRPLRALSVSERRRWLGRRIGVVFQEPLWTLNPVRRCGAQLEELLRCYWGSLPRRRLREEVSLRLREVGLEEPERWAARYPHELSGGQRQRLALALALAGDPELLIADEPTTALDVRMRVRWLELVGELARRRGMALWVVSHDPDVLRHSVDRVWRLEGGRLVEEHPARALPVGVRVDRISVGGGEAEVAPSNPLLQLKNLHVHHRIRRGWRSEVIHAVRGVDLELACGEVMSLVGRSGCGKSSLLRAIPRLIEPSGGEIRFEGLCVNELDGEALRLLRRRMPLVFQDPYASLNPRLSVREQLLEPMRTAELYGSEEERLRRVRELLELVELPEDALDRYPQAFSGGQRQRLAIARALSVGPRLLLCDEALSMLDAELQEQFLSLFQRLQREQGISVLFVTHDLRLVRALGGRVAVMAEGRIVEFGPVEAIWQEPRHPETRLLLQAARWLAA